MNNRIDKNKQNLEVIISTAEIDTFFDALLKERRMYETDFYTKRNRLGYLLLLHTLFLSIALDQFTLSYPLFIGLTYKDDHFYWYDDAPFNYSDFLGIEYKRRFSLLKKGACRRFFMYSPPTHGVRKYYTFDINCNAKLKEFFVICQYKLPHPSFSAVEEEITMRPRLSTATINKALIQHVQEGLDYYDFNYDARVEKAAAKVKGRK
ncbi:D-erythrose-4-phosphate dehydrogenase [Dirofilaria immitis]